MKTRMVLGIFLISFILSGCILAIASMLLPYYYPVVYAQHVQLQKLRVLGKKAKTGACATIQGGTIIGSDGDVVLVGFNDWGYNYQGRVFNGEWCDYHPAYRPDGAQYEWCQENMADVKLMMKWSDEWLSSKDCNNDGSLDRGYSCDPINANNSGCPGAWLTNHESGSYKGNEGEECEYNYFVKIVAAPDGSSVSDGVWYDAEGNKIGEVIWGAFAIVQEVYNDSCTGEHGLQYKSPVGPGLGKFK